jgi:ubiquinone/menaquinone biosynthesis C-methylase UbiE
MIRIYGQLAPVYDVLHRRWLRLAGGEAQAALEAAVRMAISPRATLLDAGCGTGRFARAMLSEGMSPDKLTLLDPSESMLEACKDIPVRRMLGRLEALPIADATFDIVTCAWALETCSAPNRALDELCRVVRPGGVLCLAFCADKPNSGPLGSLARGLLKFRGTGRFLQTANVISMLHSSMSCDLRIVPVAGPAAMIVARRAVKDDATRCPHPSSGTTECATVDSFGKPH